jgi:Uncharacterized protein conserved in bacteria (DUF2252)
MDLGSSACEVCDRVVIAAYLGGKDAFDQAIADFSAAYADKNEQDFSSC